jgi:hypothetical protein
MISDLPIGWQFFVIAVWGVSLVVILLAAVTLVPDLWRAGRLQIRLWLTPDKTSNVVDLDERRRLNRAMASREIH